MSSPAARSASEFNDWAPPSQETPTLLSFTGRVPTDSRRALSQEELSDMLTRKFREFFP